MRVVPMNDDYAWRFRLDARNGDACASDDPMLDLLLTQWQELLKLTIPLCDGKPVRIDAFATMREPDVVIAIRPSDCAQ